VSAAAANGPTVAIITASVGAGHNAAANALRTTLAGRDADLPVDIIDTMDLVPRWFRTVYDDGYRLAVVRLPQLYGLGFRLTDRPHCPGLGLTERPRVGFERRMLRRLQAALLDRQPDLIVHTHFLAPLAVGHLIGSGKLRSRQWTVITDRKVHRIWHAEHVDRYFVANAQSAETVGRWGVEPGQITVSGIPIHPKWSTPIDRPGGLARWSLPGDRPIVLISGGATFTAGAVLRTTDRLARTCPDAFFGLLCGTNGRLLRRITALNYPNVRAIPMTTRIDELMATCCLMVTKPGGILTAECAAMGVPMVLPRPVPGQEQRNARFFARRGAAIVLKRWGQTAGVVRDLLDDPPRLERMARAARDLHTPAAQTIADAVIDALR